MTRSYLALTDRQLVLALSDTMVKIEDSEPAHGFHTAGAQTRERIVTQVVERASRGEGERP